VVRPTRLPGMRHIYNQYTIRVPARDVLLQRFKDEKFGAAVYCPMPLHLQGCFAALGDKPGDCPEAERAAKEVVSIPVFGELTRRSRSASSTSSARTCAPWPERRVARERRS
jgi:dTDP-4-amino-4,6-dideoxygalactose transaminase